MPILVDAHEDLAWNMLTFGRDYTYSASETRQQEIAAGAIAPEKNGHTLLGWPDYQVGRVAVVFASLFAAPQRRKQGEWETQCYANFEQAHDLYRYQLETYHNLTGRHPDKFRLIMARSHLETLLADWNDAGPREHPVGLVVLMEGAEGVQTPQELDLWWDEGVRIIGPAWAGTRYCGGTHEPGPLTDDGRALLRAMSELGFVLDISHMDEQAVRQAIEQYDGAVIVSHANPAACLRGYEGNRLLTDEIIRLLLERNAIIGVVPYCRFLKADWKVSDGRAGITLETLATHIDHICQLAGDAGHVGLGSDFDGGFGLEAAPEDVDTIADLKKLGPVLAARGYSEENIAAVLGRNWLRCLQENLPT